MKFFNFRNLLFHLVRHQRFYFFLPDWLFFLVGGDSEFDWFRVIPTRGRLLDDAHQNLLLPLQLQRERVIIIIEISPSDDYFMIS